jgi:hypothetical protein
VCILHIIVQYDNSSFYGNIILRTAVILSRFIYTSRGTYYILYTYEKIKLLFYSFDNNLHNKIIQYECKIIDEYLK